ncbi:MAG TPA: Uma2 family endonuclease [Gemmataceae bacterium]|nr:Uma2 family endonuclease [Gemmataceae bacterium]
MSAPAAVKLMTTEEFLALPDDGIDRDLINGVVHEWGPRMTRRNRVHSRLEATLAALLVNWRRTQPEPRGAVHSGEAVCILARDPDVTVGIDVVYISPELAARPMDETTMIDGVPTLAVEILSPSNTVEEVHDKLDAYRNAGVPLVWLVDPHLRTLTVLRHDADPELFNVTQELTAEPHLPGFRVRVADIFVQ